MLQLTRIEPGSLAIACALLGFFLGLLLGIFGASLSFSTDAVLYALPLLGADRMDSLIKSVLMSMGPLTIILSSLVFSIAGLIGGFVAAIIYNLAAARFGGVAIHLAEYVPPEKPQLQEVESEEQLEGKEQQEQEQRPQEAPAEQPAEETLQEQPVPQYEDEMERIESVVNQRPRRRQRP